MEFKVTVLSQNFIMVPGDVNHPGAPAQQLEYFFNNLQVHGRKIAFAELPPVNDIAIQNEDMRRYAAQIVDRFSCMASVGAKVKVRNDCYINLSFFHMVWVKQSTL
jgi:hypothetical protein